MTYWPGTKIRKSTGNAFDWRKTQSTITSSVHFRMSQAASVAMAGRGSDKSRQFTIKKAAKK